MFLSFLTYHFCTYSAHVAKKLLYIYKILEENMEYAQVIIVGGGVSGLAAAKTLGHAVKYVLIEAQDYLGGRVFTVDAGTVKRKLTR